jgi:hypothetical protein
LVRPLLGVKIMTIEEVVWLLTTGAALGAAARFFLALDIKFHTAVYLGVLVLVVGPWAMRHMSVVLAKWTTFDFVMGAVGALVMATVARFAYTYARRQHIKRHRPGGRRA